MDHIIRAGQPIPGTIGRKNPRAYIGGSGIRGLHTLIELVLEVGLAEAHAKRCTHITVTLTADNGVTVEHNGQSFPISDTGQAGTLTLERALTELPAWSFRQGDSWLALVTAFSIQLTAEAQYFGKRYRQSFVRGVPEAPAQVLGPTSGQGLRITFTPDPTILHGEYQYDVLESRLRELAYLNPGLDFVLSDERPGRGQQQHLVFPDGLLAFVHYLSTPSRREVAPPIQIRGQLETGSVSAVLHFFARKPATFALYANDRPTPAGGTGLEGLLSGAARVLSRVGRREGLIKDDDDFCRHDVVHGLTAILNVHLDAIEYDGPYGAPGVRWVSNAELLPQVRQLTEQRLNVYFAAHPDQARRIVQHFLRLRRLTDAQWARRQRNPKMLEAMN